MADRFNTTGWAKREKEPERFYLFAGMGGRAARQKHKRILQWSIVAGTVVSAALAAVLYLFNRITH
jgi:hypothetical protein